MSSKISPKLPLSLDENGGFVANKELVEAVKQNVKMLLLTIPGERIMDPEFGVGLKAYLFEMNSPSTYSSIRSKINEQIDRYMPFIQIDDLDIFQPDELTPGSENSVQVIFSYRIGPIDDIDSLVLNF